MTVVWKSGASQTAYLAAEGDFEAWDSVWNCLPQPTIWSLPTCALSPPQMQGWPSASSLTMASYIPRSTDLNLLKTSIGVVALGTVSFVPDVVADRGRPHCVGMVAPVGDAGAPGEVFLRFSLSTTRTDVR
jgi:hypothetical protein